MALAMLLDDDLMHVGIEDFRHSFVATPFEDVGMAERVSWLMIRVRRSEPASPRLAASCATTCSSRGVVQLVDERDHPNAAARRHDGADRDGPGGQPSRRGPDNFLHGPASRDLFRIQSTMTFGEVLI